MASATVGLLRVILSGNSAEFEAAMKRASGAAQTWSKDLGQIGRQATQIGSALTKTITLPILALGVGSIKAAMDFETSFANVAKTVDGVSDKTGKLTKSGEALAMTFRQMAKEIPATTDELTKIAALGGQMGVPIENLEKFTRNVAALGVAVDGIGAEEAAMGLAQIANVFGDKQVSKVAEMSSALVHLGNSSNATEADILEFSKRLAGAGNAAGLTVPEVMALGTAMANVGLNAEAGGTAMSTMIAKMSMAVSTGGKELDAFAKVARMSAEEFAETWKRSPIEAIDAVVKGLSFAKASGQDLNIVVKEIGATNIRTADTMKRLAGAGDGVSASLKIANEGWVAANKHLEEAQKKYATTENQLKMLWSTIKDVGITLGNALLPAIKSATSMIAGLLPLVDGLANAFAALPGPVQGIVVGLGLALAAAGPLIWAFGQLALSASALTGAFAAKGIATRALAASFGGATGSVGMFGGALALLMNPITLTVAALGILGFAIYKIVTAETDLEKAYASNSTEFRRQTKALDDALNTYDALNGKTNLTTEETKKLDAATRLLAEASGLSVEAFNREAGASSRLTGELRAQREERTRLEAQKLKTLRDEAVAAQRDLSRIQAEIDKVESGQGTKGTASPFLREGAAPTAVSLDIQGRREELARLKTALEDAKKAAKEATEELVKVTGSTSTPDDPTMEQWGQFGKKVAGVGTAGKETSAGLAAAAERTRQYTDDMKSLTAAEKASVVTQNKQGVSLKDLAKEFKVNEDSLDRYVKSLKEGEKSSKAHTTATDKQTEALEKLGVVTAGGVNKSLGELADLIKLATTAGVPLDNVLASMVPKFKELHEKAVKSGAGVREAAAALDMAEAAAKRLAEPLRLLSTEHIPLIGRTLKDTTTFIEGHIDLGAKAMTDAFKFFGLSTRAELDKTEREAIANFNLIKASGTATPEQIKVAFDAMNEAIRKNGGNTATQLEDAYKRMGITTQKELDEAAFQAVLDFNLISNSADATAADVEAAAKRMKDALVAAGDEAPFSWKTWAEGLTPAFEGALDTIASGGSWKAFARNFGGSIAKSIGEAFGGEKGGQAAAAMFEGAVAIADVTGGGQTQGQSTLKGAAAGAKAGMNPALVAMTGGLSIAIGALAGALVGFIRGMNVGRKTVKEFAEEFGGFDELHKKLSAMGAEGEKIWINLTQRIANNDFNAAKKAIDEARAALEEFGTEAERAEKRLAGIGSAIEGVNAKAALFAAPFEALLAAREGADANLTEINKKFKEAGDTGQAEFERIGTFAAAAFAGMVKETGDAIGAINQLGPAVTILKQGIDEFGLSGTGTINALLANFDLVNSAITGPILSSIQATGQIFAGLRDGGLMTAELFQTVATDIGASFRDLEAKGGDVSKAMALSRPVLQDLWEAQEKYGTVTDETTLKLLEQAEEQGLVGVHMKDVNLQILDVLMAIADVFGADIPEGLRKTREASKQTAADMESNFKAAGKDIESNLAASASTIEANFNAAGKGIQASFDKSNKGIKEGSIAAAKDMKDAFDASIDGLHKRFGSLSISPIRVPIEYDDPGYTPSIGQSAAPASTGGFVTSTGIQYRALGGPIRWTPQGTDTVPAMLTPGEGVLSTRGMEGLHLLNSGRWLEGLKADLRSSVGFSEESAQAGHSSVNVTVINNISAIDQRGVSDFVESRQFGDSVERAIRNNVNRLRPALLGTR